VALGEKVLQPSHLLVRQPMQVTHNPDSSDAWIRSRSFHQWCLSQGALITGGQPARFDSRYLPAPFDVFRSPGGRISNRWLGSKSPGGYRDLVPYLARRLVRSGSSLAVPAARLWPYSVRLPCLTQRPRLLFHRVHNGVRPRLQS